MSSPRLWRRLPAGHSARNPLPPRGRPNGRTQSPDAVPLEHAVDGRAAAAGGRWGTSSASRAVVRDAAQHVEVPVVRQQPSRLVERHPARPVHLVRELEQSLRVTRRRRWRLLETPLRVAVRRRRQLPPARSEAGLLLDLADRARPSRSFGSHLPFGSVQSSYCGRCTTSTSGLLGLPHQERLRARGGARRDPCAGPTQVRPCLRHARAPPPSALARAHQSRSRHRFADAVSGPSATGAPRRRRRPDARRGGPGSSFAAVTKRVAGFPLVVCTARRVSCRLPLTRTRWSGRRWRVALELAERLARALHSLEGGWRASARRRPNARRAPGRRRVETIEERGVAVARHRLHEALGAPTRLASSDASTGSHLARRAGEARSAARRSTRTSRSRAGPSSPPSQPSSSRNGSDHDRSSSGRPARRNARRRRVATPQLVEVLGIRAEPCPGVKESADLLGERETHGLERRSPWSHRWCRRVEFEGAEHLRPKLGCRRGSGTPKRFREPPKRQLVSVDQLHLEQLAETLRDALTDEHQHLVVDDLGADTRTPSRRVRSRATGSTGRPRRYATSSASSSSGGRAGGPACSSWMLHHALRRLGAARRRPPPRRGDGT